MFTTYAVVDPTATEVGPVEKDTVGALTPLLLWQLAPLHPVEAMSWLDWMPVVFARASRANDRTNNATRQQDNANANRVRDMKRDSPGQGTRMVREETPPTSDCQRYERRPKHRVTRP